MNALKKKIGNLKAIVTRSVNFVENIDEGFDIELLELRLKTLEETWADLKRLQDKLFDFADDPNYGDSDEDLCEYETKYFVAQSKLTKVIRARSVCLETDNKTKDSVVEQLVSQQASFLKTLSNTTQSPSVSLPQIQIPMFSGDYKEWPCFRDLFLGSIDRKSNLTATQKFRYLKSFLRDEAANSVRHLTVSDANYVEAWDRLVQRYDRSNLIVNSHIECFLSLPNITSNNVRLLRKISDTADETIRALSALKASGRDPWLIYLLLLKLDQDSKEAWAQEVKSRDNCTIQELVSFLQDRCDALEACQSLNRSVSSRGKNPTTIRAHVAEASHGTPRCPMCNDEHILGQCPKFVSLPVDSRRRLVKDKALCFNCLRAGHASNKCKSTFRCRTCKSRHHSLVHSEKSMNISSPREVTNLMESAPASAATSIVNHHSQPQQFRSRQTILPTLVAKVKDSQGNLVDCRVLLDSGSQNSFVTESFAQVLGLRRTHARIPIIGLSATNAGYTRGCVSLKLYSRINSTCLLVDAFILPKLTSNLPTCSFDANSYKHLRDLDLADPSFDISHPVDVLLGADKLWNIFTGSQVRGQEGTPIAQGTSFGWVVTGEIPIDYSTSNFSLTSLHSTLDLDQLLRKFWELEEVTPVAKQSEDPAESHFRQTFSRSSDSRYVVYLPFKASLPSFGDTLQAAVSRLHSMERRFARNPNLFQMYSNFMREYLDMGHMERITTKELNDTSPHQFYLPHHAVLKMDSSTTKLRVVFDGSALDSFGNSLNDELLAGPPIQRDLVGVFLRFRQHRYVFCTDVVKMFRQIWVDNEHTNFQRIVWRENSEDEIQHFRLCTITYGTACAPFLAIRVLNQLADDYRTEYPIASQALLNDVYVDDVMTGSDSVEGLLQIKSELVTLLSKAKFTLRKWSSNCWPLLSTLPSEDCEYSEGSEKSVKVLGMFWDPARDELCYKINVSLSKSSLTRRTLLSEISRIFDPLGLLAPSVVSFKLMFQELWEPKLKLSWDDPLPPTVAERWTQYRNELSNFEKIRVTRNVFSSSSSIELHGFSDASSVAYSAVVYSRSKLESGSFEITIITAKTKVAPLKPLSIPRLELCGALLLSRLITRVKSSMNFNIGKTFAWTDSEVVLHWLSSPARRWAAFVANRCAEILESVPRTSWHHISSEANPADCASRGILPTELVEHKLWWTGPNWLALDIEHWPKSKFNPKVILECETVTCEEKPHSKYALFTTQNRDSFLPLFEKFSSWHRLQRTIVYCCRFIFNCRSNKCHRRVLNLSLDELQHARTLILKHIQENSFGKDINHLIKHRQLPNKSKLLRYSAFIGSDGLLRVGGRLRHANISYNIKHPIILPNNTNISYLIVKDTHLNNLHTGVSETFAIVRQRYWILGSRNLIRKVVHQCKVCFMQKRLRSNQLMGELPAERIHPTRPFINSGVDYAGPLTIRMSRGRNPKLTKAYVAIFVCMSTKAVHLEAVTDLTTDACLAALRRFMSRRGRCANIYSDNGTNFRGTKRCLTELHKLVMSQQHNRIISSTLAREDITWHFIPPSAPHFGGLWEAGVKSMKFHLRRVIGATILTFEELSTVLSQIEAILNSRPLCCLSDDDLNPLTPAHFLIGEPLTAIPEPNLETVPLHRLTHWKHLQSMVQGFWRRWHMEYLTTLQERKKWQQPKANLSPGDLVVIKEPNLPTMQWVLGRIISVTPGADGIVRVATVKTARGTFVRAITKLALLPTS